MGFNTQTTPVGVPGAAWAQDWQTQEEVTQNTTDVLQMDKQNSGRLKPMTLSSQKVNNVQIPQAPMQSPGLQGLPTPPKDGSKLQAGIGGAAGLTATAGMVAGQLGANKKTSSTLGGIGSGAMAGMKFGPWGAAAGAVIGGVAGFFKGKKEDQLLDEQQKEEVELRKEQESAMLKQKNSAMQGLNSAKTSKYMQQAQSLYGSTGKNVAIARRGGIIYSPVEALVYSNKIPTQKVIKPITPEQIQKAARGAKVNKPSLKDRVMLCSRPDGSCSIRHKSESPFHQPVFRRGGSVVNKMKKNIIPHGVLHEEENKTGIKGDKGIPIVQNGQKIFELERSELVLNAAVSKKIQDLVYRYLKSKDENILLALGKILHKELHLNTYSYDEEYAHLNH